VKFLQIWVFPDKKGYEPRYDTCKLNIDKQHNCLQQVVSPNPNDEGAWIHQQAWFHIGRLDKDFSLSYILKSKEDGVYCFVLQGSFEVDGQALGARDGLGVWDTDTFTITSKSQDAEILLIEVPMV
jgi:redox-sensitive bicupin YhaK (pirin superfamily)